MVRRRPSKFRDHRVAVFVAFSGALTYAPPAAGQACCAGVGAVTPGRLAMHEDALVGFQVRAADIVGSFRSDGVYVGASATEWDLEQDLFGALRVAPRAQVALMVPLVETYRRARSASDSGAGFGDVNVSGRYDFLRAGESRWIPGISLLAGVTFPTGRSDSSGPSHPLASDVTGVGAYQLNLGIALEQTDGPWLFGHTGLYAKRTPRTVDGANVSLGAQGSMLAVVAHTFDNDSAAALVVSYSVEGNTERDGAVVPGSLRRTPQVTLSGAYPASDFWRLQGGMFFTPM